MLSISEVSVGLLLQSKVGGGIERHLLGATVNPATLIVCRTKHISQENTNKKISV